MPEYEDTIDLYIRRSVTLDRPEHHARMLEGLRMPDGSADTARLARARDVCIERSRRRTWLLWSQYRQPR